MNGEQYYLQKFFEQRPSNIQSDNVANYNLGYNIRDMVENAINHANLFHQNFNDIEIKVRWVQMNLDTGYMITVMGTKVPR